MLGSIPPPLGETLRRYRRALDAEFGDRVISVRLFGSQARGDAAPDSDADVAVVIDRLDEPERQRVVDLAFEAWRQAGRNGPLPAVLAWTSAELAARRRQQRRIALDVEREGIDL